MSTNPATYRSATETWFRVIAMLAAAPETFRPMITHRFPLAEAVRQAEVDTVPGDLVQRLPPPPQRRRPRPPSALGNDAP